jgi:hypothetical protein
MSPVANSERQRRFRELTMKDRQLKADILDLLLAAIEAEQEITIPVLVGNSNSKVLMMKSAQDRHRNHPAECPHLSRLGCILM